MSDDLRPVGDPDDADFDDLGAAATVPVSGSGRGGGGGGGPTTVSRGRGRMRRPRTLFIVVAVIVVVLALIPAGTGFIRSSFTRTPRNMVGVSYGGGPFEAAHFQRIVQPGSGLFFNGWFDPLYLYPADTQSYIVTKTAGQGAVKQPDSIISPSKDRVPIEYQVAVYFKLNIDRLRDFHEQLGLQYNAYQASGWKQLIEDTFRQQIENALQEETRQYDVADIYGDAQDLTTIQKDVEQKLSDRLIAALGEQFFCGPTYHEGGNCGSPAFVVKKIDVPPDVVKAFQDNRTSQVQVLTAQNTIAQRAAEAQAIEALNAGLSQAGMPYVLLKAIESGQITFWVLPSDGSVNVTVPPGGGAPTAPTTTTPAPTGG